MIIDKCINITVFIQILQRKVMYSDSADVYALMCQKDYTITEHKNVHNNIMYTNLNMDVQ